MVLNSMTWLQLKDPPQPAVAPKCCRPSAMGSGRCLGRKEWRDAQGLLLLG